MSKETKHKILPKLRFSEFKDAEEWEETSLDKLGKLISGLTYRPEDVRGSGLLVLRSSNVQNGEISLEDCVYVDSVIKGANLSIPNDILICIRNGSKALIGKNALIPKGLPRCTHGAFMSVFRSAIPKFVYQLFQTDHFNQKVSNDLGATINSINGSNLLKYKFYIPNAEEEQQKIADCLSSLDDLITAQSQKLEALKAYKKGLMQQLFPAEGETVPKLRFAEFRDSGEWEEKKLGEILVEARLGGNYENVESNVGHPVIKMGNLDRGKITLDKIQFLPEDEIYNEDDRLKKGDLLFNTRNTLELVGKVAIWNDELPFAIFNSNLLRLKFDKNFVASNYFMNYIFNTPIALNKLRQIATGTTSVAAVYGKDLNNIKIKIPQCDEQQKIANCLSCLDVLITTQTKKIEELRKHKKGLMQQLFPSLNETIS